MIYQGPKLDVRVLDGAFMWLDFANTGMINKSGDIVSAVGDPISGLTYTAHDGELDTHRTSGKQGILFDTGFLTTDELVNDDFRFFTSGEAYSIHMALYLPSVDGLGSTMLGEKEQFIFGNRNNKTGLSLLIRNGKELRLEHCINRTKSRIDLKGFSFPLDRWFTVKINVSYYYMTMETSFGASGSNFKLPNDGYTPEQIFGLGAKHHDGGTAFSNVMGEFIILKSDNQLHEAAVDKYFLRKWLTGGVK